MREDWPLINCANHQSSLIALVNLAQNVLRDQRLYCLEDRIQEEKLQSLPIFMADWNEKSHRIKSFIEHKKQLYIENSQQVQKSIGTLRDEIYAQLTQHLENFENETNQGIAQYDQRLQEFDLISNEQITRDKLIDMIENFIKPDSENLRIELQSIRKRQEQLFDQVNKTLDDSFKNLKKELNFEQIGEFNFDIIRALTFSPLDDILVAGCQKQVKVFDFNDGMLVEKANLEGHSDLVVALCYSKFRNYFISGQKKSEGAIDATLKIWEKEGKNEWKNIQTLYSHKNSIEQILLDEEENQLVSCDDDKIILVWEQMADGNELKWRHHQTIFGHKGCVNSITLNQASTFLASTCSESLIKVWKKNQERKWDSIQNLEQEDNGFRIVFLNNYTFIWQMKNGCLKIFYFNEQDQKFYEKNQSEQSNDYPIYISFKKCYCYWRSPSIFNSEFRIFVTKQNSSIYIFRVEEKEGQISLTKLQEIPFQSHYLYATVSQNGKYLIGYDEGSQLLQVFKQQQKI